MNENAKQNWVNVLHSTLTNVWDLGLYANWMAIKRHLMLVIVKESIISSSKMEPICVQDVRRHCTDLKQSLTLDVDGLHSTKPLMAPLIFT